MTIPSDYRRRKRLWINASLWLSSSKRPTVATSIQNLGYAERFLLELEAGMASMASDQSMKKRRDWLLMECSAHSELWMLGLYEVLRTIRQTRTPRFEPLCPLFQKLERLRMPIAKHELKRAKGKDAIVHYPTHLWNPSSGRSGWAVFDPNTGKSEVLFRTACAYEFLAIAAIEPEVPPPFAIGGPLGINED
jgi:hypothetical protein